MPDSCQILLLSGSTRSPSYTRTLTEHVDKALVNLGATTTHWDPRLHPTPIADPEYHRDPGARPDETVRELVRCAELCDAFVLASPIYHNSFSGALKNVLDNLAIPQFLYKPVGLISHGNRSTQAVDQLRLVTRGLLAVAIPTQICTRQEDFRGTADGYVLEAADIEARIRRFASELVMFATTFKEVRRRLGCDVR